MADIALTAAQVAPIHAEWSEIYDFIATETITQGQAVYQLSTGKVGVAGAAAAGKQQFRGIALRDAGAGQVVPVLKRGMCYGFTLAGNYDTLAYLSDTVGALADAAGTKTVICGRIVALPDANLTKVLWVEARWGDANW